MSRTWIVDRLDQAVREHSRRDGYVPITVLRLARRNLRNITAAFDDLFVRDKTKAAQIATLQRENGEMAAALKIAWDQMTRAWPYVSSNMPMPPDSARNYDDQRSLIHAVLRARGEAKGGQDG